MQSSVFGLHVRSSRISSLLNFAFAEVTLRGLTSKFRRLQKIGGVVQYLAEDIRPWYKSGKLGVVIHGNPMATIETEKFYSFNVGYRIAVSRNLRSFGRIATALVQSNYVREGLEEYGYDGPIKVVSPAVDPLFKPSLDKLKTRMRFNLPADRKLVLSISTNERRKNLRIVPQVLDRLPSEYRLVRIGSSVRGAITLSNLSDQDAAEVYSACDVLLFPTLEEGFGLPAIEAFASGLPVVASDIDVMKEVCGNAALLNDPTDPQVLARSCQLASADREDLVKRGLRRAQDFSLENLSLGLTSFFGKLIPRS